MSHEATSWALNVPVGGNAKVVLLGLANHAHPDGTEAYPALDTLARYAHCHRSTARRNVRELVEAGWLIEDGTGPKGTAKYRLPMWLATGTKVEPPGEGAASGSTGVPKGVAPVLPEPSLEPRNEQESFDEGTATSEPSSASVARTRESADEIPEGFPDELRPHARIVYPLLLGLAKRKGAIKPSVAGLAHVMMARPTHALVKEAHDCVAYYEDRGQVKDVVARYRNWLDRTQPLAATERLPGEVGPLPQGVTQLRPRNAAERQQANTQRRAARLRELGYDVGGQSG